ncbi:MAG: DNA mismatch repair protein [Claussenomyces sp. TS43310]|nr:MAG: DNA mismatch repair protein [Claussenomyces sp. TS43310]
MASTASIRPLPSDVVAQIQSSVAITSLNAVVVELIKNSLDASSQKIDVSVEYPRGNCTVEDDGLGILPSEFQANGGLAKLHPREVPTSRRLSSQTNGTRIAVRDLFGNMPVRVKQRAVDVSRMSVNRKEWEELRSEIASLILAWPHRVHLILRDITTGDKLIFRGSAECKLGEDWHSQFNVEHVCNTLWQARMIPSPEKTSWVPVTASAPGLVLKGAFSLDPAPTKRVQFISFGIHPLTNQSGRQIFYEDINRLFAGSSFGIEDINWPLDSTTGDGEREKVRPRSSVVNRKESKSARKGLDRWPMFFIAVNSSTLPPSDSFTGTQGVALDHSSNIPSIADLVRATTIEFLHSHLFRPVVQGKRQSVRADVQREFDLGQRPAILPEKQDHTGGKNLKQTSASHPWKASSSPPDLIGIKVKLPSFKRGVSSRAESPFDGWLRVKSSSRKCFVNENGRVEEKPVLKRAGSAPSCMVSTNNNTYRSSIITKSGQVVRMPFQELPPSIKTTQVRSNLTTNQGSPVTESKDEILSWTNPFTKHRSIINKRTGSVIAPMRSEPSAPSTQTSQAGDCQNRRQSINMPQSRNHGGQEASAWVAGILRGWDNPIFPQTETPIRQAALDGFRQEAQDLLHGFHHSCSQLHIDRALRDSSVGFLGRLSRSALRRAEVISQVDQKFILIRMAPPSLNAVDSVLGPTSEALAVVDQHAADERCRIEELMAELCQEPDLGTGDTLNGTLKPGVLTRKLEKPICFELSKQETSLLRVQLQHLADWGILIDLKLLPSITSRTLIPTVEVQSLPPGIMERCKSDPKLLIDLVRREVWRQARPQDGRQVGDILDTADHGIMRSNEGYDETSGKHHWLTKMHNCPQGILDMLNSRSCRSKRTWQTLIAPTTNNP